MGTLYGINYGFKINQLLEKGYKIDERVFQFIYCLNCYFILIFRKKNKQKQKNQKNIKILREKSVRPSLVKLYLFISFHFNF